MSDPMRTLFSEDDSSLDQDYMRAAGAIFDLRDYIKREKVGPAAAHGVLMELTAAEKRLQDAYRLLTGGKEAPIPPKRKP